MIVDNSKLAFMATQDPGLAEPWRYSNVLAWWNARQFNTLTLIDDKVLAIQDISGHGNDLTQASTPNQPSYSAIGLNNNPAMLFDGVNTYLETPTNLDLTGTTYSIVYVGKNNVRKHYNGIFSIRSAVDVDADLEVYWASGTANSGTLVGAANRDTNLRAGQATNAPPLVGEMGWYIISVIGGTAIRIYANGISQTITPTGTGSFFPDLVAPGYLGYGFGNAISIDHILNGAIGEAGIARPAFTLAQEAAINQYFKTMWGKPLIVTDSNFALATDGGLPYQID